MPYLSALEMRIALIIRCYTSVLFTYYNLDPVVLRLVNIRMLVVFF